MECGRRPSELRLRNKADGLSNYLPKFTLISSQIS